MKSTDIIQPVAMATPIAVSGSKDTIPQEQADVEYPWYCSIEEGFPDITMTALNQGGRPPRGQGMNGLLNLISDQKVYLQNGGILTFNQNVSDTIGGYPQGAILDYVQGDTYAKVISLIDNNTVNFLFEGIDNTNWKLLEFSSGSTEIGANTDLSNLTNDGNAKFQYAPFCINNGVVDTNGQNATLSTVGDVPVEVDKYVVPVLSSTTSEYGTASDIILTATSGFNNRPSNPWRMQLADDNHIPAGAEVTFTISTKNFEGQPAEYKDFTGCTGVKITYTYTDNTTEDILNEDNTGNFAGWVAQGSHSATITLPVASKEVKTVTITGYYSFSYSYRYYSAWGVTLKAQYTVSSADTLICSPCTITAADGRTKTFSTDNLLDCSSVSDGTYKVMKSYTDGSLSLSNTVSVNKNVPSSPSNGDLWLDNSEYPLTLKQYNGTNWQVNNDLVYIGDITVSSGVITSISNNEFNEYGYLINQGSAYIPDYTSSITRATGTSFTIEAPSLLEIITYFDAGGSNTFTVTINDKTWNLSTPSYMRLRTVFLVKKGDNIKVTYNTANQTCNVVTYLLKGAN